MRKTNSIELITFEFWAQIFLLTLLPHILKKDNTFAKTTETYYDCGLQNSLHGENYRFAAPLKAYMEAFEPSVFNKYEIRRAFGTNRQSGIFFGKEESALIIAGDLGEFTHIKRKVKR